MNRKTKQALVKSLVQAKLQRNPDISAVELYGSISRDTGIKLEAIFFRHSDIFKYHQELSVCGVIEHEKYFELVKVKN